jgi:hypothetical protein
MLDFQSIQFRRALLCAHVGSLSFPFALFVGCGVALTVERYA